MRYEGRCHCGRVRFAFEGEVDAAVACNCSICAMKGGLLWATPRAALTVEAPEGGLGRYTFNRHAIAHRFCTACGIHPFAEETDAKGEPSAFVNLRCVEGIDAAALEIIAFDGRAM